MRRRVSADPLCSGLLRLPHVHLTIVDGFADPSPTRDSNACRRIVGRGLAAAVDLGSRRVGGACLPRLAVDGGEERPAAEGMPSSLRIVGSSMEGRAGAFCSRRAWARSRRRGSGDNGPYRLLRRELLRREDAPAGADRVRARRRSQAGTAGADLRGLAAQEPASRSRSSLNRMANQYVTSCHVARTVVEVRYLFRRRAGCVGN